MMWHSDVDGSSKLSLRHGVLATKTEAIFGLLLCMLLTPYDNGATILTNVQLHIARLANPSINEMVIGDDAQHRVRRQSRESLVDLPRTELAVTTEHVDPCALTYLRTTPASTLERKILR